MPQAPDPATVLKHTADTISGVAIIATLLDYLPAVAALAGIIWYAVQIWESNTVQHRVRNWKVKQRLKRRARQFIELAATDLAIDAALEKELDAAEARKSKLPILTETVRDGLRPPDKTDIKEVP